MKTKMYEFGKKSSVKQFILALAFITIVSCSKKDDPAPADTKLALPATLENNAAFDIPDATTNTGDCGSATNSGSVESTIVIDKDGVVGNAAKVSVEIDLSHAYCGDVVVQLIAPSGDSCALIKRIGATADTGNGSCGSGNDFVAGNKLTFNSTFSNTAVGNPIATGNYAPLAGTSTFPTTVPLVTLNTFFTGKNIKGTWKIKAYDFGRTDVGKINAWKLKFEAGALQ